VARQTARLGIALATALGAGFALAGGVRAGLAALVFGGLATALQTAAVVVMRPAIGGSAATLFKRHGAGMGLRLAGVAMIPIAVLLAPDMFRPLPTAFGYLGVLVPLLFFETRLFR
jgi:hypothetical protein